MTTEEIKVDLSTIKDKTYEELRTEFFETINKYKDEVVSKFMTPEECVEEEKAIIPIIDEFSKHIEAKVYKLRGGVSVGGSNTKKESVYEYICGFINSMDVEFAYTRGLVDMYNFWANEPDEVSYGVLDSTLRTLQTLRFKGISNMKKILSVNEFFRQVSGEFNKDNLVQSYYAEIHNSLLDRMELVKKVGNTGSEDKAEE